MASKVYNEHPEVMWRPKGNSGSLAKEFKDKIQNKYKVKINDYWDLHKWSVENIPEFWAEIWDFFKVIHSKPYDKVVDRDAKCGDMPEWFQGARLNYAENILKYRDDHAALIITGEERSTRYVTYAEMYEEVCLYGAALKKHGVKKGDVIACYMSNREEPVYAALGVASIGALWTGNMPYLGAKATANRFKETKPKILFTIDRFKSGGSEIPMLHKVKEIADELPSLEKVIIVPSTADSKLKDISGIRNSCFLDEFLDLGRKEDGSVPPLEFEQLPFDHPLYIIYTSGTTGTPKCLVHRLGGIILSEYASLLDNDDTTGEKVHPSLSPVGWVSWNLFLNRLALGITLIVFEGVPFFLSPTHLWDMVDEFKITYLFLPSVVLDEMENRECLPSSENHLKSLVKMSSGSTLVKHRNYDFVYKKIKADIRFSAIYACSELMVTTLGTEYSLPIHKGEIPAPALGIEIKCLNDSGQPVTGEIGEMVLTKPTPALLLGLWDDPDRTKYTETYHKKYPDHFSFCNRCLINPITKGVIVYGRSDEMMKPALEIFDCFEIYNVVDTFEEVLDTLCVPYYGVNGQERVVLFVKMKKGYKFTEELVQRIRSAVEYELTKHHMPELILEAKDIPRNMNGKKMEALVKRIINKMTYDPEVVMNPQCLEYYKNIPELHGL